MTRTTVISAPGKVLFTGGYLVLDQAYSGLVIATSSRFYTTIRSASSSSSSKSGKCKITVRAGQFPRDGSEWSYSINLNPKGDGVELSSAGTSRNKFVQITLDCALRFCFERLCHDLGKDAGSEEFMRRTQGDNGLGLEIVVLADNDFYSQRETLSSMGLSIRISSLNRIPPFASLPRPIQETNKTGLGSSAALVTSLTAAILSHLEIVSLPWTNPSEQPKIYTEISTSSTATDSSSTGHLDIVHSLAQYAHCLAQGKVGSGFDVSSAVYGTQQYRRFSPSLLKPLIYGYPTNLTGAEGPSLMEYLNPKKWDSEAKPFRLPRGLRLILADVDAGTDTPSFVGKVLDWRKRENEYALKLWTELSEANTQLAESLQRLRGFEEEEAYSMTLERAAKELILRLDETHVIQKELKYVGSCLQTMIGHGRVMPTDAKKIRHHMREMSEASNVPIEPPEQTRLLDRCCASPGVIGGVVPGAGGYDALVLLLIDHPSVLSSVEEIWSNWTEMSVCPLSSRQSDGGLRKEELHGVVGLNEALNRI